MLTAQVSASAVRNNLQLLREQVRPGVRFCSTVKADAYGHGINILLDIISESSDMLAVSTPREAVELRVLGYQGSILMFQSVSGFAGGSQREEALNDLITQKVTLTLVSPLEIPLISSVAQCLGINAEIHVKIDTGMARSGIPVEDALGLVHALQKTPGVKLTGIYTHFAAAGEYDKTPV